MTTARLIQGDCLDLLQTLESASVQTCVTSPPYFGLRDYGAEGQIGLEETPEQYVQKLVAVFREVRRVLRDDGTLWLNLGDSYAGSGKGPPGNLKDHGERHLEHINGGSKYGLKPKDIIGIPWRVAFALQADGWYLRQDIIWNKPNPMPESVKDRCTKAHEYIFLLSKSAKYFFDADAIAEPITFSSTMRLMQNVAAQQGSDRVPGKTNGAMKAVGTDKRNKRSVWNITTKPFTDFVKTDRLYRVAEDAVSDDMKHIVFPNCPTCADQFDRVASVLCDERADAIENRISRIDDYLAQERVYGFAPIVLPRVQDSWRRNSDLTPLRNWLFAIDHNRQNRKTDREWWTNLSCNAFVQTLHRIADRLDGLLLSALYFYIVGNSISLDEIDARLLAKIPHCNVGKSSCSYCQLYHVKSIKSDHFATFPIELPELCIKAGSRVGDTVLDPFNGAASTGVAALRHGRNYLGLELNPEYIALSRKRLNAVHPLFAEVIACHF